jgi:predicted AAA+ superfamily ATPase
MEDKDVESLLRSMERRIDGAETDYHRPLYGEIDWDDRLVCITGAKGTGKTTMMLQYLKEHPAEIDRSLYVSLDSLWFANHSPLDVVEWHHNNGGTRLFIDEVHHYRPWQTLIKNIYDEFPKMTIAYSGSSMMRLAAGAGDLSRRQRVYELKGLSFREYLAFEGVGDFAAVGLEDVLSSHRAMAREVAAKIPVLRYFANYLECGYYPFYKTARGGYLERLHGIVEQTLERDYPEIEDVTFATIKKAEKMLMILAQSCPQVPNMNKLYAELETDRNQGLKILYALQRAGLLSLVSSKSADLGNLSRPDKIYCDNPNLMYALAADIDVGTLRETFFVNQLRAAGHDVKYPPAGDFKVDGKWLFEIGGKGKTFKQIADIKDSFVVNDGVETGIGNKIPLWLFGFLH